MTVLFNGTKKLGIVCGLHMKLDDFVLTLFPYLKKDTLSFLSEVLMGLNAANIQLYRSVCLPVSP